MDLAIKNGKVFNGIEVLGKTNIYVENGKIAKITNENLNANVEIDAKDMFVMPGLIDAHIHLSGIKGGSLLKIMFENQNIECLKPLNG